MPRRSDDAGRDRQAASRAARSSWRSISSEANLASLDHYRGSRRRSPLVRRMAARCPTRRRAPLAREGKAVVWVDFGLHSSEVAHGQTAPLLSGGWRRARPKRLTYPRQRHLAGVPNMNPDGTTLVADWYMTHVGTPWEKAPPPELYQQLHRPRQQPRLVHAHPAGVAGRRPAAVSGLVSANRLQPAPGRRRFPRASSCPPFEDPVNPHIPPLVMRGINTVGDAITRRLDQEGKVGAVSRLQFDTWWNGGMRTAPYFHNMVGILTETAHATASPARLRRQRFPRTFSTGLSTSEPSIYYPTPYRGGPVDTAQQLRIHGHRLDGGARHRQPNGARSGSTTSSRWAATTASRRDGDLHRARRPVGSAAAVRDGQHAAPRGRGDRAVAGAFEANGQQYGAGTYRHPRRAAVSRLSARPAAPAALSRPAALSGRSRPTRRTTSPDGPCRCRWACASTRSRSRSRCPPGR